jgi:hypothetical protein
MKHGNWKRTPFSQQKSECNPSVTVWPISFLLHIKIGIRSMLTLWLLKPFSSAYSHKIIWINLNLDLVAKNNMLEKPENQSHFFFFFFPS